MAKQLVITDNVITLGIYNGNTDPQPMRSHRVTGILPGCRKEVQLTFMPTYGAIVVRPMFGHNGVARISPETYANLVARSRIENDPLFPYKDALPNGLAAAAIEFYRSMATCGAVTSREHVHPNYKLPPFTEVVYE